MCALPISPIVPSRTTFSSDSPPLVVTVWARGVASARTAARAIRDESRMLPPSDRMPERGEWAMASESTLPSTLSVVIPVVTFNSRITAKLAQSVNDKTRAFTQTFDDLGKSRPQTFPIDRNIHARTVMVNSANHWHERVSRRSTQHGPWTPRQHSHLVSERELGRNGEWLAALDDFRNWLIRTA